MGRPKKINRRPKAKAAPSKQPTKAAPSTQPKNDVTNNMEEDMDIDIPSGKISLLIIEFE